MISHLIKGGNVIIKKSILAIDDDREQLKMYAKFLGEHYFLIPVKSVSDALKILDLINIDLILLDIEMPNSGFDFMHEIRKKPKYMTKPIIIVCVHNEPEYLNYVKNSCATSVLTKPVDAVIMIKTIEEALSARPKSPYGI